MRHTRGILFLVALLWLSGCASSGPAPQRYALPGTSSATSAAGADADRLLLIRSPRLAQYLDVDGIVYQLDDITLTAAREHQWAEPLGRQLERGLRARLTARLPTTRVMIDDGSHKDENALGLRFEVDRFQGRHDGLAVVGGQWQLRRGDGRLLAMENFLSETELEADGYPALVRALGRSWDEIADEISRAVRRQE